MIPEVSAGSNHVGASVTCTAQVSWPSGGPAARIEHGTPSTKATARRATTCRRTRADRPALPKDLLSEEERESIETAPALAALSDGTAPQQPFRLIAALASTAVKPTASSWLCTGL